MCLHYFFTDEKYNIIFFVKEYFQLITCAYICYFYLYQMYMFLGKHTFLTYFGLFSVVSTVVYISVIGVYFSAAAAVVGPSIFFCSNPVWLMVTAGGCTFSVIFVSIGVVVNRDLKVRTIMYKDEVIKKVKKLWVLIYTYVFSALIELVSFSIFMGLDSKNCLIEVDENTPATLILFIIFRSLTDYPLISVVLYQLWNDIKTEKRSIIILRNDSERLSKLSEISNLKFTLGDHFSSHNSTN